RTTWWGASRWASRMSSHRMMMAPGGRFLRSSRPRMTGRLPLSGLGGGSAAHSSAGASNRPSAILARRGRVRAGVGMILGPPPETADGQHCLVIITDGGANAERESGVFGGWVGQAPRNFVEEYASPGVAPLGGVRGGRHFPQGLHPLGKPDAAANL